MSKTIKRIAITGPFADVNFGDYAMLVNNVYDLDIKNVTLFSYDNDFLDTIKNDYLNEYNVDIVEVEIDNKKINISSDDYTLTPVEVLLMIENYNELHNEIKDIDVLIVNGGGYFNGLWSMPHRIERLLKIIGPILIANQLNKKIIFTGNGYGPFGEDEDFFLSIFSVIKNAIFGSRDNLYSPFWAQQVGIDEKNIRIIPDDLLMINDKILSRKLSTTIDSENYIVVETYLPIEYLEKEIEHFRQFAIDMHEKYDLSIIFLPLNLKHGGMDQALYLNKYLQNYEFIDIRRKGYLPIQDAVEVIKNAKLVVSSRYHSLVVALSTKTPTISVLRDVMGDKRYYYNKNSGILNLALKNTNYDERYYLRLDYIETLDFIRDNFNTIIKHQEGNYNSQYKSNLRELRSNRIKFLDNIKHI